MRIEALAIGLTLSWAAIGDARATDVQFTITGDKWAATFELPLSPTPDPPVVPGFSFEILSVPAVIGGSPTTIAELTFVRAFTGLEEFTGGFEFTNQKLSFSFFGPQFYSGPESDPTFIPGVYTDLRNFVTGKIDTVTVSRVPDPPVLSVPEPSTWAMLLLGFVGLGYAGYNRRRHGATVAAQQG